MFDTAIFLSDFLSLPGGYILLLYVYVVVYKGAGPVPEVEVL